MKINELAVEQLAFQDDTVGSELSSSLTKATALEPETAPYALTQQEPTGAQA